LKYWLREPVLGFGVGSHSFDGAARYANVSSVDAYLRAVERGQSPVEWRRDLRASEGLEEALFLGLRLRRGVDWRALRAGFSSERASRCDAALEELCAEGLVEPCGAGLRLTRRGMLLSNEVCQMFV
jgi:oxygen-independent coproporphyrinogen-3 oxidase